MKFKRTRYPDWPGSEKYSSPCWQLLGKWVYADADWNTRFPFGTSLCVRIGRDNRFQHEPGCKDDCHCSSASPTAPGFYLDANPPLGEPNRFSVWAGRWQVTLGLPSLRDSRPSGSYYRGTEVWENFTSWRSLHIDGLGRWLTIERRRLYR